MSVDGDANVQVFDGYSVKRKIKMKTKKRSILAERSTSECRFNF